MAKASTQNIAPIIALVTGASGQVGQSIAKIASHWSSFQFHFCDSTDLDITDPKQVETQIKAIAPDVLINCAAYTAVDKAETNSSINQLVNAEAPLTLAKACKKNGTLLFHYSSDYVYHSITDRPLKEDDHTVPQGQYAQSKKQGEQHIINSNVKAIIMRTSWVYSEFGNNFVSTMLRLADTRNQLTIVDDQIGAPTYATDIAEATLKMIYQTLTKEVDVNQAMIINYAGYGQITWKDFAAEIFAQAQLNIQLEPTTTAQYGAPAARPLWSVLDMTKLKTIFGIAPKYWKGSLKECMSFMISNQTH